MSRDPPGTLIWGWASMAKYDGQTVRDFQGDEIEIGDLQRAAHNFMTNHRHSGVLHMQDPDTGKLIKAGEVVESLVTTPELCRALGVIMPHGECGWLIGVRCTNEAVRKAILAGHLGAFSIGGSGLRSKIDD